jgi:hypothetical protein
MDKITFSNHIDVGINRLENRQLLIQSCLNNSSLIKVLLTKMEQIDSEESNFASRILELTCKEDLKILASHIDDFSSLLSIVKLDGVVRSCAKICELLCIQYFLKENTFFINLLKEEHLEKMTEAGFNWMITDQKIAVQAYTMQTLYLLGAKYNWINEELALNLENGIPTGSTGYVNRARKVIKAIRTKTPLKL